MMKRIILSLLFIGCYSLIANAVTITPNSVYRVKNNSGRYMSVSGTNAVATEYNATDENQEWFFEPDAAGTGYYLRNVSNGAYSKSPLQTSGQWTLVYTLTPDEDTMLMVFKDFDYFDTKVVFSPKNHTGTYQYAHKDSSNNVVCWSYSSSSPNSTWALEPVTKTDAELKAIQDRFNNISNEIASASTYEGYLNNLFEDKACTVLKPGLSLSDDTNFKSLSLPLQRMVTKIANKNWDETNRYNNQEVKWDDAYAKKYRVQYYEPFSEGYAASDYLAKIWAYTNMNNPSGIVGDKGDLIYIMVEEEPADGSTLYINEVPDSNMYNSATSGTKLHRGLNIIQCTHDNSHFFIYYTVNSTNSNRALLHKLSEYDPIKIHIEGGRINGFFNYLGDSLNKEEFRLYEADKEEDLQYTLARATHPMFDLIGKYIILHIHLYDIVDPAGGTTIECLRTIMRPSRSIKGRREETTTLNTF